MLVWLTFNKFAQGQIMKQQKVYPASVVDIQGITVAAESKSVTSYRNLQINIAFFASNTIDF
jgi:hypothetical protein